MQIGFTTTSLRQIRSLEKIVDIAARIGVDCIEWAAQAHVNDTETAKLAKKLCGKADIAICSYGSYYRVGSKNEAEWKKICEIAHAMEAKTVRVWLGKKDSEKTDPQTYALLVEDAKSMCDVAAEYGICVCCECHDNTYNNNTDAFLKIQKDINRENFKTYFQSRYRRKEYDLDRIERTLAHTEIIHFSYFEQKREQFPHHDPSYGDVLLDSILHSQFDGPILIEYTCCSYHFGFPPCLQRDVEQLRKKVGCQR